MADVEERPFDGHKSPDLALVIPSLAGMLPAGKTAEGIKDAYNVYRANKSFFDWLWRMAKSLIDRGKKPSTQPVPAFPAPPPVATPPTPTPVPAASGAVDDIAAIDIKVRWLEEPERWHKGERGHLYDRDTFARILAGQGNAENDSRVAYDATPRADSGTEYTPDDPRWGQARKHPGRNPGDRDADCPLWFEYRFNGNETDGPNHAWGQGVQSPEVEPESVVSDGTSPVTGQERRNGCTPVVLVTGSGTIEGRLHYLRHDGRVVSSPWSPAVRVA